MKTKKQKKGFGDRVIESDFDIPEVDLNRLDEEWLNQPRLRSEVADLLAEAKREVEIAAKQLKEAESEAARDIRINPTDYGYEKATDNAVKELVPLQKEVKAALMTWIDAKYKVDRLVGRSAAVSDRKHSLENLVELRLADYFGEPRPRSDNGRKAIEHIKQEKAFNRMKQRQEEDE